MFLWGEFMVYTYGDWKLHEIVINVRNAGPRTMYFFSKKKPKKGTPCDMPEGYEILVNQKTGLPVLKYKNKISLHQRLKQKKKITN